jgi:hypothetical protein
MTTIAQTIIAEIASVRNLDAAALSLDLYLSDLGIDSVGRFLIANRIIDIYKLEPFRSTEVIELFEAVSISDLVELTKKIIVRESSG